MKTFSFLITILSGLVVCTSFKQVDADNEVTFYRVPLECNAAADLGCGSRSKPVLLALEKSDVVEEAWLNRQGDVIAVVWKKNSTLEERKKTSVKVFRNQKVNASELLIFDLNSEFDSFESKDGWYNSETVNLLSEEEAGVFADRFLVKIKEKSNLDSKYAGMLRNEIKEIFYDFFLNFNSLKDLADPDVYREKLELVVASGEKYVGEGNMPSVDELWQSCVWGTSSNDCCKGSSCKVGSQVFNLLESTTDH